MLFKKTDQKNNIQEEYSGLGYSSLIVSVTAKCNFNCPHCLRRLSAERGSSGNDLPVSIFEKVLTGGQRMNFNMVVLTGGEPILHSQFGALIEIIKKYNYRFSFISNGWFYNEYFDIIKNYKDSITVISLSLDGATAKVHDSVREKPGSFERVMEAIKFYSKESIPLLTGFCLTKQNYDQIEKIANLCLEHKIKMLRYNYLIAPSEFSLSDEELDLAIQKIFYLRNKFRNRLNILISPHFFQTKNFNLTIHFCSNLNGLQPHIDHDGGMIPCCDIYRECKNKPLIQEKGFEECYRINLDVINEIKKQRLQDMFDCPENAIGTCAYCNRYIENCLNLIKTKGP